MTLRARRAGPVVALLLAAGCAPSPSALLAEAFEAEREALLVALDRDVTTAPARTALREALLAARDGPSFAALVRDRLELRPVDGDAGRGVHFTAYYAPEYPARRARAPGFDHPLHGRPENEMLRRRPRREIVEGDLLAGREIAWLEDALSAYLVQVNGSARLRLPGGRTMHVGHMATNGRPYTSLGRLLIDGGIVDEEAMSMAAIRAAFEREPDVVEALMLRNDRYVFFEEIDDASWPRGSTGAVLTPHASCATDPDVIAPGSIVLVETVLGDGSPYVRLVVAQDTGGAIRGGRIDLYFGVGEEVGAAAGAVNAGGRAWILEASTPPNADR